MNPVSKDVVTILESISSLGLALKVNLFVGMEPADKAKSVTLFDTAGGPPAMSLDGSNYNYSSLQIRVKHPDYDLGMEQIYEIADSLHGRANELWNGTLYTLITKQHDPTHLDFDDQGRPRFIVNLNFQRR